MIYILRGFLCLIVRYKTVVALFPLNGVNNHISLTAKRKNIKAMDNTFSNNQINVNGLPNLDAITFTPLNSQYRKVVILRLAIIVLFLVVLGVAPMLVDQIIPDLEIPKGLTVATIAFAVVLSTMIVVVNLLGLKQKGYAIREKDIIYKSGLINRTETVIPFNRVQHVGIYEGVLLRVFNLCTLEFFTAGGAMGDLKIPGLSKAEGDRLKAYVIKNINEEKKPLKGGVVSEDAKAIEEQTVSIDQPMDEVNYTTEISSELSNDYTSRNAE